MAYSTATPPVIISEPLGSGPTVWQYTSTDSAGTIAASGYFSNGAYLGMSAGDVIFLVNSTTGVVITASMLSSTSIGTTSPSVSNAPILIGQSYSGATRTSANATGDTSYTTIASVVLPGGTMGLNSKLVVITDWDCDAVSTARTKTLAVDFGGTNIQAPTTTTLITYKIMVEIQNLNSLTSQKTANSVTYVATANPRYATSIDTTINQNIDFKCKWDAALSGATITLLGYSIWHYPGS